MRVICPWGWSLCGGTPGTMLLVFSNEESERYVDANCIYERAKALHYFANGMNNLFIIYPHQRPFTIEALVVYSFP